MFDLFVLSGEPSGDLQGALLVRELLQKNPHLRIGAVSGKEMRKHPIETLFRMEDLEVMGFLNVLFHLPRLIRAFFRIRNVILKLQPPVVVCIDYPGFHLRLARSLRKKGFRGKLVHFVCPSVWAWRKKRIFLMEKHLDLLLTLLPFEKKCFANTSLRVEYVGHPLTSLIPKKTDRRDNVLALFPGSRVAEIEDNLPYQLRAAKKLQKLDPSLIIQVSIARQERKSQIERLTRGFPCQLIEPEEHYLLMQRAKCALATSGTVTLELALHETPTVVHYFIRPIDLFLAQTVFRIRLPYYSLANLIVGKELFPELFGPFLTDDNLIKAVLSLFQKPKDYAEVRQILGEGNASEKAAHCIHSLLLLP